MKNLTVTGIESPCKAEKIVKTTDSIIGYTDGKEVFAFKGVSNFSLFTLDNDESFDVAEPTVADLQSQIFTLTTTLVTGGVI